MTAETIATIVAYASAIACVWGLGRASRARRILVSATRQLEDSRRQLEARMVQAREDRAFAVWATFTMLTITDAKGYIHAGTLRQLYTTGRWDEVWDAPIAVALWHGDPDVLDRFTAEADRDNRTTAAAEQEEESDRG